MIPADLNGRLCERKDKLLLDIIKNNPFQKIFATYLKYVQDRGGGKLGMDNNIYYQLIKIACQHHYGVDIPAKAFMTREIIQQQRRLHVKTTVDEMKTKDDLKAFVGHPMKMMDNWKTGQQDHLLFS